MLAEYQRSGLSLRAYARRHGHSYGTLLRWRARSPLPAGLEPALSPGRAFIPVELAEPVSLGEFVLSWPNGRSLRVPVGFDAEQLRRLLSVVEGAR